jgi:hypothetical protein
MFLFHSSQTDFGAHPGPYALVTGDLFSPRVKLSDHESDHPPSSSAEVKKMWIYTFTPP